MDVYLPKREHKMRLREWRRELDLEMVHTYCRCNVAVHLFVEWSLGPAAIYWSLPFVPSVWWSPIMLWEAAKSSVEGPIYKKWHKTSRLLLAVHNMDLLKLLRIIHQLIHKKKSTVFQSHQWLIQQQSISIWALHIVISVVCWRS